jgi:hypothetical protein
MYKLDSFIAIRKSLDTGEPGQALILVGLELRSCSEILDFAGEV